MQNLFFLRGFRSCQPIRVIGTLSFFPGRRPDGSPRIYVSRSHRGTEYIESESLFRGGLLHHTFMPLPPP
jgi:hypothetical protein